jgi:hypothetical protein
MSVNKIYYLEKDSKKVNVITLNPYKKVEKIVNLEQVFQHNF